ncbi:MAG: hypothetical protein ACLPHP_02510 [Candidatus Sulfotelmatobacter sp.]
MQIRVAPSFFHTVAPGGSDVTVIVRESVGASCAAACGMQVSAARENAMAATVNKNRSVAPRHFLQLRDIGMAPPRPGRYHF